jgi:predicted MFS family arabinose efflux permease
MTSAAAEMTPPRRWPVVSGLGVVMIFTWGSTYYLMAVLARPIAETTGWGLGWVTGALSAGLLTAGLASPLVGRLIGAHGGRRVLAAGCAAIALGLAVIAAAPTLWAFWTGWLLIGLGMAAGLYDPAFATLGRLFGTGARGPITQLTLWGGFASTVCWPLSAFLLDLWGWRGVAVSYAALNLFVLVPLVLLLVPSITPKPAETDEDGESRRSLQGTDTLVFYLFALMLVLHGLMVVNVATWLFAFLQAQGLTLADAVALGALIGPAQVGARLLELGGRGRHHPVWTLAASVTGIAAGLILLALDLGLPGVALILFGGGNGLFYIARGALPLAVFGAERYPVIVGRTARPALLAQAIAPSLGAWAISSAGPQATLLMLAALGLANVVLLALLWRLVDRS